MKRQSQNLSQMSKWSLEETPGRLSVKRHICHQRHDSLYILHAALTSKEVDATTASPDLSNLTNPTSQGFETSLLVRTSTWPGGQLVTSRKGSVRRKKLKKIYVDTKGKDRRNHWYLRSITGCHQSCLNIPFSP